MNLPAPGANHRNDNHFSGHTSNYSIQNPSTMSTLTRSTHPKGESARSSVRASDAPFHIEKASGHPKTILNERYQKEQILIHSQNMSSFYPFSDNRNGDHDAKWSAIFVCPKTGETFLSGELLDDSRRGTKHQRDVDGINWYGTSKQASCAVAGRAEDCFRFRERPRQEAGNRCQFCQETPYLVDQATASLPLIIPRDIRDKVQIRRDHIVMRMRPESS